MNKSIEYYKILEVPANSSIKDISKSFHELTIKNHPEKNNYSQESKKKFQKLQKSYKELYKEKTGEKNSFFPTDEKKLVRLKPLINGLDELESKYEEKKNKDNESLKISVFQNTELEKLKVEFLKYYKTGPLNTKYTYLEIEMMIRILDLIKDKEPNKMLDSIFQGYKDELVNRVCKPLAPLKSEAFSWFASGVFIEERIAFNKKFPERLLSFQNTIEKIEKIRYLSPTEKTEYRIVREFDENYDPTPIEINEEKEKVDYSKLSKQDLIVEIEKLKLEIQKNKKTINPNSSPEEKSFLTEKEEELKKAEKKLSEISNQSETDKKPPPFINNWLIGISNSSSIFSIYY